MSLWFPIKDESSLRELVRGDNLEPIAILKHSDRCSISYMAMSRLEKEPDDRLKYYLLNVIEQRSLSNLLEELTGTQHESPQLFLFNKGNLILNKSHMSIRPAVLSQALDDVG